MEKFLDGIKNQKIKEVLTGLSNNDYSRYHPDLIRINEAIKAFSEGEETEKSPTFSRHILQMFRIFHMANFIFKRDLLTLYAHVYFYQTRNHLPAFSKGKLSFTKIIREDMLQEVADVYEVFYDYFKEGEYFLNYDLNLEEAVDMMNDPVDFPAQRGIFIMSDITEESLFDKLVKSNKPAFYVRNGIVYPRKEA